MCNALVVPCKQCTWQCSLDDVGCVRPKSTGGYCKHGNTFHSLDYSLLTVEMYGQMKENEDNEFTNRRKQSTFLENCSCAEAWSPTPVGRSLDDSSHSRSLLKRCSLDSLYKRLSTDCLMHPYIQGAFNVPCTRLHWSPIDSPSKNHTPTTTIEMTMGV